MPFDKAISTMLTQDCDGIGFILGRANIVVVDIDHCIDESGELSSLAREVTSKLDTYMEYSQSKKGLHIIFVDNDLPIGFSGRKELFEIYCSHHYFAVTGYKFPNSPTEISILDGVTKILLKNFFTAKSSNVPILKSSNEERRTDEEVLAKLQNNKKFNQLYYEGNFSHYNSQSEGDMALLCILARATNCCAEQMRRLFSESQLGKRSKWQNAKYQNHQITGAINFVGGSVEMGYKRQDWYTNRLRKVLKQNREESTLRSGFSELDEKQKFRPGLYVLGGIPSVGKTTWVFQLSENWAEQGEPVLFFTGEMSVDVLYTKSLIRRIKQANPNIDLTPDQIKELTDEEIDNDPTVSKIIQYLSTNEDELHVKSTAGMTIEDMIKHMEHFCTIYGKGIVVIDYLQRINTAKSFTSVKQQMDYIVDLLQSFQREHNILIVLLSSFNRANYKSSVNMESFKETGDIESSADVVWGLQYAIFHNKESGIDSKGNKLKGVTLAELEVEQRRSPRKVMLSCIKNRFGNTYEVYFDYYSDYDLFEERKFISSGEECVEWGGKDDEEN